MDLESVGHNYIPVSSINLQICQTPVTLNQDIFTREGYLQFCFWFVTVLSVNCREATNSERILIIYGMLCEARFGDNNDDNKYGIQKLLSLGAVKAVYPLHDGPHELDNTLDEFLNDRQVLPHTIYHF